jgi:outer membrane protein OmpA-like peptidoglycan-associated protein
MKISFPQFVSLTVCIFVFLGTNTAQKTVLVNGEATKVTVSDNNITSIKGTSPGYMAGYADASNDVFTKVQPRLGSTQATTSRASAPVAAKKEPLLSNTDAVSFAEGAYEIEADAKKYLNSVAKSVKSGEVKTILLKTGYKTGDSDDISLTRRRLDSCKRHLESKGVGSNLILTSMVARKDASTKIAVLMK